MNRRWLYPLALVISLALFALASMTRFIVQAGRIADIWSVGFPFVFYEGWGPCRVPGTCQEFFTPRFILDLLFWLGLGLGGARLLQRRQP